jgi:hypothetical protein
LFWTYVRFEAGRHVNVKPFLPFFFFHYQSHSGNAFPQISLGPAKKGDRFSPLALMFVSKAINIWSIPSAVLGMYGFLGILIYWIKAAGFVRSAASQPERGDKGRENVKDDTSRVAGEPSEARRIDAGPRRNPPPARRKGSLSRRTSPS